MTDWEYLLPLSQFHDAGSMREKAVRLLASLEAERDVAYESRAHWCVEAGKAGMACEAARACAQGIVDDLFWELTERMTALIDRYPDVLVRPF